MQVVASSAILPTQPSNESICKRMHTFFARVRQTFVYGKTARQVPIVTEAGKVALSIIKSPLFIQGLQGFLQKPKEASVTDWMSNIKVMKGVGSLRLCVAVAMIASVYLMIEQGIEIRDEIVKGRWREGIDAALRLTDATGVLADSTASFTIGLSMIQAVKASQILWVTPLAMGAAALATASVALEARGWHQSTQILKMLKEENLKTANKWGAIDTQEKRFTEGNEKFQGEAKCIGSLDPRLRWIYEELTNETRDGDYFLRRHFEVINREKYTAQILDIILEKNENNIDEEKDYKKPTERQKNLLSALYARTDDKIGCHKLGLISAIISIIGLVILFIPGAPVASAMALLGVAALAGTIRFVLDYKSTRRLEKWLDKEVDFNKISLEWLVKHSSRAIPQSPFFKAIIA